LFLASCRFLASHGARQKRLAKRWAGIL